MLPACFAAGQDPVHEDNNACAILGEADPPSVHCAPLINGCKATVAALARRPRSFPPRDRTISSDCVCEASEVHTTLLRIGFLNDLFCGRSYSAGPGELSI